MKTKNVMQKLLMLLILTLAGSSSTWAYTYTFHIVNKADGTDIITATNSSFNLPDEIKSPMCDFRYYDTSAHAQDDDSSTGIITSGPGSDTDIYVAYTIKSAYEKYFSTAGNEHWYYAHCNGDYVKASSTDIGASKGDKYDNNFNKYTDQSYMWTLIGDPYQANLCVRTHGISEPLVRTSDSATTLRFSSTVTDKKFIVLDAGSGGFSFRYATEASGSEGDFINKGNPFVIWKTNLSSGRTNSGNKWTFLELQIPVNVTYHLISNTGYEGFSLQTQAVAGGAPNLPNRDKLARLNCTIGTTYYSDAACTTTISSITESTADVYVQYTFDAATLKNNTNIEFSTDYAHAKWMTLRFNIDNTKYLQYNSNASVANIKKESTTPSDDSYEFAFIGDPFKFRIVNKAAGSSMDAKNTNDNTTTKQLSFTSGTDSDLWALVAPTTGTSMFQIMLASTYADNASFYWNNANPVILYQRNNDIYNNMLATLVASAPTVEFTQTSYTTDKNTNVTITANATLNGGTAITYTAIERKNADGTYTQVATANAATVSYTVDASEYGNYTYRAVAVPDGRSELIGTSDDVTVTVQYPTVSGGPFTLKLVDKSGNILFTKENVTGTDVQNSFGDPLPAEWRSPMVTQYKYYTDQGQTNAKDADDTNLLDWTVNPTSTVYVGYTVGDALDLNDSSKSGFTSLNADASSLMQNRVVRGGTTDTHVRNASKFGKMYMLKFKTSADYYAEDTKDRVSTTVTPSGSYVYPYTNGDGPIYVYPDQTYQETRDDGASTRTRYPWFLFSPNNDPYHVYITSWQTSHNQKVNGTTNYYSYLRTYYNSTLNQVVTSNVTDDPTTKDGTTQILPTEYMLLTGNGGTDGAYKLMTVEEISNGTTTERRTVTSLEQYWRNNPTAQVESGGTKNVTEVATNNATLTGMGWHNYEAWVNAAKWDSSKYADDRTKNYLKAPHWFQTIQLGDGSLDIVETNIDGVLVLLDNHGWEIMRHPIVQHTDPDYASVKEALKKYDSPMVSTYKFYATRNVDHKVAGYHKYNINNSASKALTDAKHLKNAGTVITSLADYPETMDNGALADLYVTYEVKEEYKANYAGAATEAAVTKSAVNLLQGGKYANANETTIEAATSASGNTSKWYLKPNFNIDAEMGYKYDVDENGLDEGDPLTEAETNAAYHAHRQSGFDPYNIQIQNVADETKYFTTNATEATLDAGKWSGNGATVSLADVQSHIAPTGYDQTTLAVTNTTFMAVQDANGNMRLMPRFDHSQVVDNFTTLAEQATLNAKNDNHSQSTKLSVGEITYKVIDNSGTEVFSETVADGAGISLPRRLESPFVEKYTYHSSLELATGTATRGITSDVTGTNIPTNHIVYVGYKVKDTFGNGNAWNIFGAGTNGLYVHPVYQSNTNGKANTKWWMMANMQKDFAGWNKTINTSNFPFLDNGYAWEFAGENPDPYNALLFNKGAKMYIQHYNTSRTTDYLTPDATDANLDRYAFVYFDDNEEKSDVAMYNRAGTTPQFVRFENNNRLIADRSATDRNNAQRFVVTQLPQITINVVNSDHVVEVSLQGYYKKGASWTNSTPGTVDNTPFYLDRAFAQGHTFYYDRLCTDEISGTVSDSKVLAKDSVFVSYTLANDWGAVNEETPDYGTTFRPADNDYLYWYVIRPQGENGWHFKASTTDTPSEITGTNNYTFTNENINDEASRLTQWTFRGTPYNLKIVDRYHGESSWVGVSKTAVAGDKAYVYETYNPEQITTTWELTRSLTGNTPYLYIRPQRSLEGSSPLLYLSYEYSKNCLADFLKGVELKFVKKTPANTVTFKIQKGHDDIDMTTYGIADYTATGVPEGQSLSSVFSHSPQLRRYCEYKFYSDAACTTELTTTGNEKNQVVYVKWDYTDDAPVFSQESWNKLDYQYYMLGVWGFNNYNLMDVEGEGTTESPYTFKPNSDVGTPRDLKHQFAVVGNPYGFKLYNRAADKDIKRNKALEITFADKEADGMTPTEEITFDLPIVSGRAYTSTETHFRSTKTGRYLSVTGTNESRSFSMTDKAGGNTRFRYLIIPVRVFPEGKTALADQVDYRMYAKEMNPGGQAVSTDAYITTDDLRATANSVGSAYDFVHAFCDYTFYRSYNWSTGTLSGEIPADGLSYYGGKEQTKRQFFATYVVDREQFENIYLLAKGSGDQFSGKGSEAAAASGYDLTYTGDKAGARADTNGTYRWVMTGDPYNLQLTCLGTGEFYKDMPLSAAGVADNNKLYLSGDANNYRLSHFEVIKRHDGKYRFYLREDLDNDDDVEEDRYQYHINPSAGFMNKLILFSNSSGIADLLLFPAIPQHNVTWHVMEKAATGDTYTEVATATVVKEEGEKLVLADLPQEAKRHFCEYNAMYGTLSGGALSDDITTDGFTVPSGGTEEDAYHIYVPYTLDSGAPEYVTEADVPSNIVEKNWYEIHFVNAGTHIYYNSSTAKMDKDAMNIDIIRDYDTTEGNEKYQYFRWALVGTPYHVMFYNKKMGKYLTSDGIVGDLTTLSDTGTIFDLPDDDTGEFCDIRDVATGHFVDRYAVVNNFNHSYTPCEFTNTNGVVKIKFVLHFSDKTQRSDKADKTIQVDTYQKLGKSLDDVLPERWKRAFCKYTYTWNEAASEEGKTPTIVSEDMVSYYNLHKEDYLYVYVTYDYETDAPFKWSTADKKYTGKHWYYLVNNHRPSGEQGKMVYRDVSPKLRVSTSLQQNRLYLNNFEWCVIGDPYGFKMLNRYDPDRRFEEYIRVTDEKDSHGDGLQLEQSGTDSQNIFEMMPGQYSYNFWMHPVYTEDQMAMKDEYDNDASEFEYVGNNYNGSAAIIPTDQRTMAYLKTNSSANFRLEIQSDATLAEYVKYAGFVGGLKYDKAEPYQDAATHDSFTDEEKTEIRALVDEPANIVQMEQGYYRIVPFTTETQEAGQMVHKYLRGYWSKTEQTGDRNLKVIPQSTAEYAPTSIFWFEGTTSDYGYPRYFIKTQDLCLGGDGLVDVNAATNYKSRYEDLGAAITQLKISDTAASAYLSCTSNATEASTNQCFDEQAGQFKTRFYLQKVGTDGNEMPYKIDMVKGHNGINGEYLLNGDDNPYGKLPYTYWAIYVPYDLQIVGGLDAESHTLTAEQCDVVPFVGIRENYHPAYSETGDTYYNKGEYALICQSIDEHQKKDEWKGSNLFIPAATPVFFRSRSGMTGVTFKVPTTKPTTDTDELRITENCLRGTYLSREDTREKIRVFGKEAKLVGSTWYYTGRVGLFPRSSTSTPLTDNGIYYVEEDHISSLPNTNSARAVFLTFDESKEDIVTGIYSAVGTPEKDVIYDLQGRKMTGTLKAGVYIKNGRKVVVK